MNSCCFNALLFDLDGTLVDSLPGIAYSFCFAMDQVMPGKAKPNIDSLIGPPIREIFRLALNDAPTSSELDALEAAFRISYDNEGWCRTIPYPGVIDGIAHLVQSGATCYVVTNKPQVPVKLILDQLGISRLFCEVVTRESRVPPFDSKLEATLDLSYRLKASPEKTLFIGDSLDDAEAARACGFRFASAEYGFGRVSSKLPNHIDFHLPDFAALLAFSLSG